MRALSLWQPHALAIGIGLKPWETRGWSTDYRGPIAIHAAKRSWTDEGPWHSEARRRLADYVAKHGPVSWHFGAVVATAVLVSCMRTSELRGRIPAEHEFWGDFSDGEEGKGRFAFKLEDVKMLAEPVYCRGMQSWFEVDLGGEERSAAAAAPSQLGLFDSPSASEAVIPELPLLFDTPRSETTPAAVDDELSAAFLNRVLDALQPGSAAGCEASRVFAQACERAGYQYRGYEMDGSDRLYFFSPPGLPAMAYRVPFSMWDQTTDALLRAVGRVG